MVKCTVTGQEIPFGKGKMFVKKDGKILYFSSRKAEKNFLKLKRNPRNLKYTEAARIAKQQHMAELAHAKEHQAETKAKKKAKKAHKAVAKESVPAEEAK